MKSEVVKFGFYSSEVSEVKTPVLSTEQLSEYLCRAFPNGSNNLFFSPEGSSLLQSPYSNLKSMEIKTIQRLLLGDSLLPSPGVKLHRILLTHYLRSDATKTILGKQGHSHSTEVEFSKQYKDLLPVLCGIDD